MTETPDTRPGILLVLDGWGHTEPVPGNALAVADTPVLDGIRAKYPATLVEASGEHVGLLPGTVGNSEIGHMVIGAGRPLDYDSVLVQRQIDSGGLRDNPRLTEALDALAAGGGALHLIGLASDGQIHAHVDHLHELLSIAAARGVERVWVHAITDGRDVADRTACHYLGRVEEFFATTGVGRLATVSGRGYALDKSGDLELTAKVTQAVADGRGALARDHGQILAGAGDGDVWVTPTVLTDADGEPLATVRDGDAILFANFRSDRIQQLADDLVKHLAESDVRILSLTQYDTEADIPALVGRADASGGLADQLEAHGLRSVRIAEQEKFEHVTYYLNGRDERRREVEEHVRITSDEAPEYTARPEMNLDRVADAVIAAAGRTDVALVAANLANIDVVGHTGDHDATVRAAEHTDRQVDRILTAAAATGRWVVLVGDHGNAERMSKPGPDGTPLPYGGHTTNPVPAVVVPAPGQLLPDALRDGGSLADIAPTVLALLGRPSGPAMTGRSLL
ncbi:2,3-bisphosphoglycerate-independent phosphoglycerate mutase [Streptomyces roseolus]|uniref:2,3-bisphosphoglycerate-independent phosphoglycerate mutase n=1 Tax=Streptomyces roseolus TaxID=67358 RepID=UPI001675D8C5|nr:2,3-bisphosphoglycerate-independent phosphoglycerate mutase [Streptomyces roseolus]GGR21326.1 2,3-bisphosphoglycerate-independent phosphoglycerate mutase [Streptomyces roseolus]